MEFPYGHHSHTHHNRRDDDYEKEEERRDRFNHPPPGTHLPSSYDNPVPPYPPPPFYGRDDRPPQPPSYYRHDEPPPPPQPHTDDSYYSSIPHHRPSADYYDCPSEPPPPPQRPHASAYPPSDSTVCENQHVSPQSHVKESETYHNYRPHLPSFLHHHTDQSASELSNKPIFKVITKANPNFSLAIQDGRAILTPSGQADDTQHWYKDEKYSTRVKDSEGFPCFALVNKATGQALKHSVGASHPVQLIPYNSGSLDESILWTQSKDMGDGYRTIRMVNNIRLNVDAFHGDKKSGGVHKGTTVVLWDWNKGENQLWKIIPYGA